MNYDILTCFSRFCHFLNFGWFWDGFTMNFESMARFPARGWFQITLGLNFTQNGIFIKDVTGRNKNYQKYQPCDP